MGEVYVNVNGSWRKQKGISVNVNNQYREVSEAFVNVGGAWKKTYQKVQPVNLLAPLNASPLDGGTTVLLPLSNDYFTVSTSWVGTGLSVMFTGLEPNTKYSLTLQLMLLNNTTGSKVNVDIYNVTKGEMLFYWLMVSATENNTLQTLTSNFTTDSFVSVTDEISIDILNLWGPGDIDQVLDYRVYKNISLMKG